MTKQYFDLHVHAIAKNLLVKYEDNLPSSRQAIDFRKKIELSRDFMQFIDDQFLHLIRSQSSFHQIAEGRMKTGVASIAPLELGYAGSKGLFGKIFKSKLTAPLDQTFFKKISAGEISYLNLFLRELEVYRKLNNHSLTFLSRKNENNHQDGLPGIVFSMEGGHGLSRLNIGQTSKGDLLQEFDKGDTLFEGFRKNADPGKPQHNLKTLFESMWKEGMDLLYLTLTHLTHISEQYLATHAFGLKMIKHPAFYPSGCGISDLGKEVVSAAYEMKIRNLQLPILIDIKHMSLQSRLDFYAYRKEKGYQKYPIIASHVAVTGYTIKDWKDAVELDQCKFHYEEGIRTIKVEMERKCAGKWGAINKEFTFNPWSINLMDEDIIEILESKGLIGLILDVRVLGFQSMVGPGSSDTSEYLSTAEFTTHFPNINIMSLPGSTAEELMREEESWLLPTKEERHPLCLCFNLVHIHCIGRLRSSVVEPLAQICLGTDFDGLIEPLKTCRESSDMDNLRFNLLKWLPIAAKAYQAENGGPDFIFEDFVTEDSLRKMVDNVLYDNGDRFIQRWLKNDF